MKSAYSMLLGEYVSAVEVEHADTTGFQIVCPCCRDAVFKVARGQAEHRSEFFSHHKTPADIVADCELRVNSISESEKSSANSQSRAQSMQAFRRVLGEALELDAIAQIPREEMAEYRRMRVTSFDGVDGKVLSAYVQSYMSEFSGELAETTFVAYEFDLELSGLLLDTSFARNLQKRIAVDLLKHVAAPHATKSRNALIGHALLQYRRDVQNDMLHLDRFDPEQAKQLAGISKIIDAICVRRPITFSQLMIRHAEARQRGLEATGMMTFLEILLTYAFGTLTRLPYREMLANHRAGRNMLDGVRFHTGIPIGTRRVREADRDAPHGMM